MRNALVRLFSRLSPQTAAAIQRGETVSDAELSAAFGKVLEPQLAEVAAAEGGRLASEVGVQFDPAIVGENASVWARSYSYDLVRGLTDTTRNVIRNAVSSFQETPDMTRRELVGLLDPAFGRNRAEAIAVTEVTRAHSAGMSQYQQRLAGQGVEMEKVWNTLADELVCPICGPLNGQPESEWRDRYPDGPPAHVRCRCSATLRVRG